MIRRGARKTHEGTQVKDGTAFDIVNGTFMMLVILIYIVPLMLVVSTALMSNEAFTRYGYSFIPREASFSAFAHVFRDSFGFIGALKDTVIVTVSGTFLNLIITAAMGYGLSNKKLPYRNAITAIVFFTMLFGGGMIPTYMVVRGAGLLDSYWALILPSLVSAWNTFLMRNFFMSVPESLLESAGLDGANEITVLFRIVIPLSMPSMATMALFYGVGHWNEWMGALLYMPSRKITTLQYFLRTVLDGSMDHRLESIQDYLSVPTQQLKMAALIVTTVPMLMAYPFLQRYFVKGIIVGSIKG